MARITRVLMALVCTASIVVGSGPTARASACSVVNARTGSAYDGLQRAVSSAARRDVLRITGTCVGSTTAAKPLTFRGVPTAQHPRAVLNGGGSGSVLVLRAAKYVIRDLVITNGKSDRGGGIRLGSSADLVLSGSTSIRGNDASVAGGGIWFTRGRWIGGDRGADRTKITLTGATSVIENSTAGWGAGIYGEGYYATLVLSGSASVSRNAKAGIYAPGAEIEMRGRSTVSDNGARGIVGFLSGPGFLAGGSVTLSDQASIRGNDGRGIDMCPCWEDSQGSVTLNGGASIEGNRGGGIAAYRVTLNGSSTVRDNEARRGGGGILSLGWVTLTGSASVTDNTTERSGGGILVVGGTHAYVGYLTMKGTSSVTGNVAADYGGGVYAGWDHVYVKLKDSVAITGNAAGVAGGGIYTVDPPICVSELVVLSPNDPDDPPATEPCAG